MITDEQIREIYKYHMGVPLYGVINLAREYIALAQQVKPLNFEDDGFGGVFAQTNIGIYDIYHTSEVREPVPEGDGYYFERNCRIVGGVYTKQSEAIAAANEDYKSRVLSCLVNGGT